MTKNDMANMSIEALVQVREGCAAKLTAIDEELASRGVRVARSTSRPARPMAVRVHAALSSGPLTLSELRAVLGIAKDDHAISQMVHKLCKAGELVRVDRAKYGRPTQAAI